MGALAAGISAGASILGGISSGKGAAKAAKIQAQAYEQGIAEQDKQFNTVQANNQPYMQAGQQGLGAYLNLLGLGTGGAAGQQTAIDQLKASPLFTSQYQTGNDTLLQNLAATGGLRGGNGALDQSNFGANLLSQVIQNQLGNYGGLIQTGQAAASGTNAAALSTGDAVSTLLAKQGGANTVAAYAPYGATTGILDGLDTAAAKYFGGGGTSSAPAFSLNGADYSAVNALPSLPSGGLAWPTNTSFSGHGW